MTTKEPRTRKTKHKGAPFPELLGMIFHAITTERDWILLWKDEWILCHAWGGWKGCCTLTSEGEPINKHVDGYFDQDLLNPDNYYMWKKINTKARTPEKVLNAVASMGLVEQKKM